MHLFTITIHSNLFGKDLADFALECMAYDYLVEVNRLMEKYGLASDFSIEAYWTRGSLVEHFLLVLENAPLIELFTTGMAYKTLKEYKQIRENVILIANDIKKFKTVVAGEKVSTWESLVSETKPPKRAKKVKKVKEKMGTANKGQ